MSSPGVTTPATGVTTNDDGGQQDQQGAHDIDNGGDDDETGDEADTSDDQSDHQDDDGDDQDGSDEGQDDDGGDETPPEPETVEFEDDHGTKHKIPKALEKALLRNGDYTQKTQKLAEDRKVFESQQESAFKHIKDVARLHNLHEQIQSYEKVDWDTLQQQDPDAAASHWRKFTLLKDEVGQVAQTIHRNESEAQATAERERATRMANAVETCAKEIPGWSPAYATELGDFGQRALGFTKAEMQAVDDPRVFKALHLLKAAEAKAKTAEKVKRQLAPQKTQPAPQAKPGGAKPTPKDPSKMNMAQYAKWRAEHPDG